MILIELYILDVTLLLVLAYSAWRLDRRDLPLTLLRGYVLATDICIVGLETLRYRLALQNSVPGYGVGWSINVLFVSAFAGLWVTAFRYHRGRWPQRLGRKVAALAMGLLLVSCAHYVQRQHMGLGPLDVGVKWVALNLACLVSAVLAGWHLAQVLRKQEVALAHLVLGFFIVISLVQFMLALKPGAWDMSLHHLANLLFLMVSLAAYGLRLVRRAVASGSHLPRRG